jgi:mannose-6-phosphate isomerase-like protein (cupin superfamily)
MTATEVKTPVVQSAADAPRWPLPGGSLSIRLRSEQTGGELAAVENVIPAHYPGPPRHVHPAFDELFYVLEGAVTFTVGDEQIAATAGAIAYVPGATPHTFSNPGDEPVRLLTIITPAGFEAYFEAIATAAQSGQLPPPERMAQLMDDHGVVPA